MCLCRLGIQTPMSKEAELLKVFLSLCTEPNNFHNKDPSQMKVPSITGMNNIATRPTNVRLQLKCLNSLAIPIR